MGVRTHVGTYVRRYAAHTYVRIAAEQILRCVCLEKGAWLRAHVRVAGSGQRRRRSEKEKGPISYVRCAYVRTYLVQSSDTYADVRAYIRTYVRVYVQNALRTFVIRTYSRGSRSAMREEPVNQGHALPVNATVRAFRRVKPGSVSGMLLNNSCPSRGAEVAAAARPCTSGGRRGLQLPS